MNCNYKVEKQGNRYVVLRVSREDGICYPVLNCSFSVNARLISMLLMTDQWSPCKRSDILSVYGTLDKD